MNIESLEVTVRAHRPWLFWRTVTMTKVITTQPGETVSFWDCGRWLRVSSSNSEECMLDTNSAVFTGIRLRDCSYIAVRKL
jgi:hypothetical protein